MLFFSFPSLPPPFPTFSITFSSFSPLDEEPDDAEIFTLVQLSENKVALKSGYGRYLGVNSAGEVIGKAEAVAAREQWEAIFEEVRNNRGGNDCLLTV